MTTPEEFETHIGPFREHRRRIFDEVIDRLCGEFGEEMRSLFVDVVDQLDRRSLERGRANPMAGCDPNWVRFGLTVAGRSCGPETWAPLCFALRDELAVWCALELKIGLHFLGSFEVDREVEPMFRHCRQAQAVERWNRAVERVNAPGTKTLQ